MQCKTIWVLEFGLLTPPAILNAAPGRWRRPDGRAIWLLLRQTTNAHKSWQTDRERERDGRGRRVNRLMSLAQNLEMNFTRETCCFLLPSFQWKEICHRPLSLPVTEVTVKGERSQRVLCCHLSVFSA